jgi:hypothetical protein
MLFVASASGWVAAFNASGCFTQVDPKSGLGDGSSGVRGGSVASSSLSALAPPPPGRQWAVFSRTDSVAGCLAHGKPAADNCAQNSSTPTWLECARLCQANFSATGGPPSGCGGWSWNDATEKSWANACLFRFDYRWSEPALRTKNEQSRTSGLLMSAQPGPQCAAWARPLAPAGPPQPSYSPVRVSADGTTLLVSTTDAALDTGGVLHAIDSSTGAERWAYAASVAGLGSFGLKGVAPALLPQNARTALLAFGPKLAAIDIVTGLEIASWTAPSGGSGSEAFVSSPVVSARGDAVYLHGASGALWSFNIAAGSGGSPPSFSPRWSCVYAQRSGTAPVSCGAPPVPAGAGQRLRVKLRGAVRYVVVVEGGRGEPVLRCAQSRAARRRGGQAGASVAARGLAGGASLSRLEHPDAA